MNEEKDQRSNLSYVSVMDRHLGKGEMENHTYNVCILVTSVHAKFGASATKIERRKCQKCEAPNEGDLAQIQCIALMKFIMHIIETCSFVKLAILES